MENFHPVIKGAITDLLGGTKITGDVKDLTKLAEAGLPKEALIIFLKKSNLEERRLYTYLDVTKRTLANYKPRQKLRLYISDRLIHLAQLYAKGKELFDTFDHFNEWLNRPSLDLAGDRPIDRIQSRAGVDELLAVLGRLEHGVLA
jgi:putative toxin-antitoxin system antitoxin component (TIGR02293 family)